MDGGGSVVVNLEVSWGKISKMLWEKGFCGGF